MFITKLDDTKFEVNILNLFHDQITPFMKSLISDYGIVDTNEKKKHLFNILFLTPSNLASNYYKTSLYVYSIMIDGVKMREKQDTTGISDDDKIDYHDITNIDEQIYFNF